MSVIEIKDLKTYFSTPGGEARAVDGVSFDIDKGETFALVGESGCGKSATALSIIQLVAKPQGYHAGGSVTFDGVDITKLSENEKRKIRGNDISMIFQEPMTSLNPVLTIGEQVIEPIMLHQGKRRDEARVLAIEMLEKVRLASPETIFDEYPHRLSGGMRQRVMIAMALGCAPKLLIADEPTTALDVTIQKEILELIGELKDELGTSVLLITHNLALVYKNADNVAVMYAGVIVEKASVEGLFANPMHPYTIKLLRSIPSMDKRGRPLDTITGTVPPPTGLPGGCRFSGRCDREMNDCAKVEPRLIESESGHIVRCHLYDEDFLAEKGSRPLKRAAAAEKPSPNATYTKNGEAGEETVLEVSGLKCYYPIKKGVLKRTVGYVKAVDGIEVEIKRAKTLALVGESGCGKTTAGKSIMRLVEPSGGVISLNGTDITGLTQRRLRPYRSEMQIIFQDPYSSLNPRQTIGEIIEEGLKSLKPGLDGTERSAKVTAALEMVGLDASMAERYPHEFSGGQRQRIAIARVLAVEPELVVSDEATSALDVSVQAQILNLIKTAQSEIGVTFLFITHDLGVVEYIADEVAVMSEGRIVEHGSIEEVFGSPKNPYTKRLLSAVPRIDHPKAKYY